MNIQCRKNPYQSTKIFMKIGRRFVIFNNLSKVTISSGFRIECFGAPGPFSPHHCGINITIFGLQYMIHNMNKTIDNR